MRPQAAGRRRRSRRARWRCSATRSPPTTSRPAGNIKAAAPGRPYLVATASPADFNSYGARRGNHEVMMRGTFANVRIKNLMMPPKGSARRAA
jgi:aconitase A